MSLGGEKDDYELENKEINIDILTRRAEESVTAVQKISENNFDAMILQGQAAMK